MSCQIQSDQLNTPRVITDSDGNVVWRWDGEAFGNTPPTAEVTGAGQFVFNLRFPGQYYDAETGLYYNAHRDYDPTTGRYFESDPVGLYGGISTFGYGGGNPLSFRDPKGLWSTAAHNAIINAYGNLASLPPEYIAAMQQGSYDADHGSSYQDSYHSYMHAMSSSKLSKAEACKMLNDFVGNTVAKANALADSGDQKGAYYELGFGLHAIMDSTSPAHAGFQEWHTRDFLQHGPFPTSKEDGRSLTPEMLNQTLDLMIDAINGGSLDCSWYK